MIMKKYTRLIILIIFCTVLVAVYVFLNPLMPILTGHAAKNLASAVFISGRQVDSVRAYDISFFPVNLASVKVDYDDSSVVARLLWAKSKAVYRKDAGVALLREGSEEELLSKEYNIPKVEKYSSDMTWPMGEVINDTIASNIDLDKLGSIADGLIAGEYGGNPFTFMVLHNGVPVVEKYKSGFNAQTRLLSWSMAKSVVNAMTGLLVGDGKLDIYSKPILDEWRNDERAEITLNDILQMQSGLEWNENYGNESDVNVMLHVKKDIPGFVIAKPSVAKAGKQWLYSSGSTNIASEIIRRTINSDSLYYDLAYNRLLAKIGVRNPVFETDLNGVLVGSSYLYMTTRDYARFGLLYLRDGVFNGERILPEGWVDYTSSPASASDNGYGSCFWLNSAGEYPDVPRDMYSCNGHNGQNIFIIPSEDLVVVMTGFSPKSNPVDKNSLLKDVINSISELND